MPFGIDWIDLNSSTKNLSSCFLFPWDPTKGAINANHWKVLQTKTLRKYAGKKIKKETAKLVTIKYSHVSMQQLSQVWQTEAKCRVARIWNVYRRRLPDLPCSRSLTRACLLNLYGTGLCKPTFLLLAHQ